MVCGGWVCNIPKGGVVGLGDLGGSVDGCWWLGGWVLVVMGAEGGA